MQPTQSKDATFAAANPNEPLETDGGRSNPLEDRINAVIKSAQEDLELFTKNDQSYRRKDTVEVVKDIMTRIKDAITELNAESEETRQKMYYLIYNATIIIFKVCH